MNYSRGKRIGEPVQCGGRVRPFMHCTLSDNSAQLFNRIKYIENRSAYPLELLLLCINGLGLASQSQRKSEREGIKGRGRKRQREQKRERERARERQTEKRRTKRGEKKI